MLSIVTKYRVIRRTYYKCAEESMDAAGLTELDKRIKDQNEEYYELYDALAKSLKKKEQIELLEYNRQFVPDTKHEVSVY